MYIYTFISPSRVRDNAERKKSENEHAYASVQCLLDRYAH